MVTDRGDRGDDGYDRLVPEIVNGKIRVAAAPVIASVVDAPAYAELDAITNFSFLRGASHPDEMVYRAAELGYRAIAIADINSLAGVVRAYDATKQITEQGGVPPKLIIGSRLVFQDAPDLLVWAPDRATYSRLCRLLTLGKRRTEKGKCELYLRDFLEVHEGFLGALILNAEQAESAAIEMLRSAMGDRLSLACARLYMDDDQSHIEMLRAVSRRFNIPLLATNHAHYHDASRRALQDVLTCIRHGCTIESAGYRLFPNGERYLKSPAQMRRLFADDPAAIARGLEIAGQCTFSLAELRYEYPDEIVPAEMTAMQYLTHLTWRGAEERFGRDISDKFVPIEFVENPACTCEATRLAASQRDGRATERSSRCDAAKRSDLRQLRELIQHELQLIAELKIEAYFLTVYDIVKFARSRGILCQGRGSAANSAVCFCLGITSVDPTKIDLLFERFVSAARNEPPDIDVDFEHERREEVIQYLYEKYGRDRAGLCAEVITYRGRSAVRDVGKAMGLSLDMVNSLAKKLDGWHRGTLTGEQIAEAGLDPRDPGVARVIELTGQIMGFPRHLSQHVGGMVMTRGQLRDLVPIENASMPGRTVIEWDKDDIDTLGILKVDILALGMLTCISKALKLVNEARAGVAKTSGGRDDHALPFGSRLNDSTCLAATRRGARRDSDGPEALGTPAGTSTGAPLQMHTIPSEDPGVYDMLCRGDSVGVFQVESRAQMSMLPRLKPRCFYDLVIEVAIVRPGPIQGNMVHPYLRRRSGQEPVSYPSQALEEVLRKTLGVPLFQEQAMRLAMVGAGFSAGDADRLRRAMAAWRRSGALEQFQSKVINGMLANGYTQQFAEQCFEQIKGFGEYGFPESHSASFALLVYVSAWLKKYHPGAFACALLNSQPMGFYAPAQIVRDASEHGVTVLPIDVNKSDWDCTLEYSAEIAPSRLDLPKSRARSKRKETAYFVRGSSNVRSIATPSLRLGMRLIRGLSQAHADRLVATRERVGEFHSITQLARATSLSRTVLQKLAAADAFNSIGLDRREALWQVLELSDEQYPLFDEPDAAIAPAPSPLPKMSLSQHVLRDYATTSLSTKAHPCALVREELAGQKIITSRQVAEAAAGRFVRSAGLVLIRQRPGTASGIVFETIEDETGVVNLVIRPDIYERFRQPARFAHLLRADGYIQREGIVTHLIVKRLYDLSHLLNDLDSRSRDFH